MTHPARSKRFPWISAALVPFGWTDVVTYALSVAAIVITGVVLIQSYRDTAAIHAKLDELLRSDPASRTELGRIDEEEPERIEKHRKAERR